MGEKTKLKESNYLIRCLTCEDSLHTGPQQALLAKLQYHKAPFLQELPVTADGKQCVSVRLVSAMIRRAPRIVHDSKRRAVFGGRDLAQALTKDMLNKQQKRRR